MEPSSSQGQGPVELPPMRQFTFKHLGVGLSAANPDNWKDMLIDCHSTQVDDSGALMFFTYALNPQGMFLRHAFQKEEWASLREIVKEQEPASMIKLSGSIN